jgi:hypothetical protein
MAKRERSQVTAQAMDLLWANTRKLKPQSFQEQTLFTEIVNDLNNIAQLRAERLGSAFGPKLISIMRTTLVFGAIITLTLAFFFGAESFWWHTIMTILLAILIASILFVILELVHQRPPAPNPPPFASPPIVLPHRGHSPGLEQSASSKLLMTFFKKRYYQVACRYCELNFESYTGVLFFGSTFHDASLDNSFRRKRSPGLWWAG